MLFLGSELAVTKMKRLVSVYMYYRKLTRLSSKISIINVIINSQILGVGYSRYYQVVLFIYWLINVNLTKSSIFFFWENFLHINIFI